MREVISTDDLRILSELKRKVLWLASWTIHRANYLRDKRFMDLRSVGMSFAGLARDAYNGFRVLRPQDQLAVKLQASPNFQAIQYLLRK
jgi:pyruvate dehydrogenase E1 component